MVRNEWEERLAELAAIKAQIKILVPRACRAVQREGAEPAPVGRLLQDQFLLNDTIDKAIAQLRRFRVRRPPADGSPRTASEAASSAPTAALANEKATPSEEPPRLRQVPSTAAQDRKRKRLAAIQHILAESNGVVPPHKDIVSKLAAFGITCKVNTVTHDLRSLRANPE